ncbi:MAG: glycosyltransferase [Clostridium sp.]|nr:glycosyltransferase [Roseburia sp.]MCM1432126.1 glycosyltransferase [Muribaculaceae bacterium]MCM1499508.1 glycosyltransferase [Clostridium sp.]
MLESEKISVLMPVYNGEIYLHRAIQSILDQSYRNFELIILLEYGSNKRSREIIRGFKDNRIRVIENEKRLGLAASLNVGIGAARGSYIARMDADDVAYKHRFRKQMKHFRENPDIVVSGTAVMMNGRHYWRHQDKFDAVRMDSFFECPFFHPTVMWRKDIFIENNLLYQEGIHAEDYELWTRALDCVRGDNISSPCLMYRVHEQSKSHGEKEELIDEDGMIKQNYWEKNGFDYSADLPEQIKEFYNRYPSFPKKDLMLRRKAVDYFLGKTMSIKGIRKLCLNEILRSAEGREKKREWKPIPLSLYITFRVCKRRLRLMLSR